LPREKIKYTLEDYLELDRTSEEKIEFWDGHVFTLAGASPNHNQIQSNLNFYLRLRLQGKNCRVYPSDMRVKVPEYLPYRYPDLSALCGEAKFENLGKQELLVNPSLIVEILSDSTETFDRSYKFTYYKSIETFVEYVLIAQDRPHVWQFVKQSDNAWLNYEFNRPGDKFYLPALDCDLNLSEIYEAIEFSEQPRQFNLFTAEE
jgi:Uma2 family endonuclease